jgi:hypothetical protein
VCYLSAGTWESWRPDQNKFPEHLKKENYYSGSSREKWLDITKWGELKSIMQSRLSMAKSKGCDAIEFVCSATAAALLENYETFVRGCLTFFSSDPPCRTTKIATSTVQAA